MKKCQLSHFQLLQLNREQWCFAICSAEIFHFYHSFIRLYWHFPLLGPVCLDLTYSVELTYIFRRSYPWKTSNPSRCFWMDCFGILWAYTAKQFTWTICNANSSCTVLHSQVSHSKEFHFLGCHVGIFTLCFCLGLPLIYVSFRAESQGTIKVKVTC